MSEEEPKVNTVVTEAIAKLMEGLPVKLTHGLYNRHMFLESVVLQGRTGVGIDQEDIQRYGALTDKEFVTIKDEYVNNGIILEEKNMFDVILYRLKLT